LSEIAQNRRKNLSTVLNPFGQGAIGEFNNGGRNERERRREDRRDEKERRREQRRRRKDRRNN
jgi:hypothetical protein